MGMRFRKIFSRGPLRATCNGRGLGWSVGLPGFRLGVSADGRPFVSLGVPGTGISYARYFSRRKP